MEHKLDYGGAMSNIMPIHCLANKTVCKTPWWPICFPLSSSYGGVKGHFTGIEVGGFVGYSDKIWHCCLRQGPFTFLHRQLWLSVYMIYLATYTVKLWTCFILNSQLVPLWKERFNKKKKKEKRKWYSYDSNLFPVQRVDLVASR